MFFHRDGGSAASGAPGLGRRRAGLGRFPGLPGLGPPREPGRRGFAVGRLDVAPLHSRELPALQNQLLELRQAHRGGGCLRRRGARARAAPTAGPLHSGRRAEHTLPGGAGATTVGGEEGGFLERTKPARKGGST